MFKAYTNEKLKYGYSSVVPLVKKRFSRASQSVYIFLLFTKFSSRKRQPTRNKLVLRVPLCIHLILADQVITLYKVDIDSVLCLFS